MARSRARKVEDRGFDALYAADHPGITPSPFAALSAAAAVTTTLRLGTYVLNCGVHEPLAIASEIATLDVLSDGRSVLGLGAGHTPVEWTMSGRAYPSAADRVARLREVVDAVVALVRGDVVTRRGEHVTLDEAYLMSPRPVQESIPLLIGGNGRSMLRFAGATADIVGFTGLARTLADGHRHAVDWRAGALDERVALVRAAATGRDRPPIHDVLVQHVEITDDREGAVDRVARMIDGCSARDVLGAPFVLVGSRDEIAADLAGYRERWSITSYVVRADAIDAVAPLLASTNT